MNYLTKWKVLFTFSFLKNLATLPGTIVVELESTMTRDKLFQPTLEPTFEHGLAEDLFEAIDNLEDDCATDACDASIMKCGLTQS